MIELKQDQLVFSFPEVHEHATFRVELQPDGTRLVSQDT